MVKFYSNCLGFKDIPWKRSLLEMGQVLVLELMSPEIRCLLKTLKLKLNEI